LKLLIKRGDVRQPVLIFRAGEERIVSNMAMDVLRSALPAACLVDISDSKHEILNEKNAVRAVFWREVEVFLAT